MHSCLCLKKHELSIANTTLSYRQSYTSPLKSVHSLFSFSLLAANLLHTFCSTTAYCLQYHCILLAAALHISLQPHCILVCSITATALQYRCNRFAKFCSKKLLRINQVQCSANRRLTLVCYQYLRLVGGVEANFASTLLSCFHSTCNTDE